MKVEHKEEAIRKNSGPIIKERTILGGLLGMGSLPV